MRGWIPRPVHGGPGEETDPQPKGRQQRLTKTSWRITTPKGTSRRELAPDPLDLDTE
jgi:hypothetical protein